MHIKYKTQAELVCSACVFVALPAGIEPTTSP